MVKVSFDFDSTLSTEEVQEYAKELISRGIDVWVVTTRWDENHKHKYFHKGSKQIENAHKELWEIVDRLGIPRWKVRFTNMEWKHKYLTGAGFLWHLDDNREEITEAVDSRAADMPYMILVEEENWKEQCDGFLNKKK